ncbi:hypothetical protein GQX74_011914 [Glossina fuscipes]|nr:hypothetical protein GQX74_011914 [Glossina fuscipes]
MMKNPVASKCHESTGITIPRLLNSTETRVDLKPGLETTLTYAICLKGLFMVITTIDNQNDNEKYTDAGCRSLSQIDWRKEARQSSDKDMLFQVAPASANLPPYIRPYVPSLIRCSDSKVPGCTLGIRRIFSLGSPELPPAVLAPPNILPLPRLDFGFLCSLADYICARYCWQLSTYNNVANCALHAGVAVAVLLMLPPTEQRGPNVTRTNRKTTVLVP